MNISASDLHAQVLRARAAWPFIDQTNTLAGLPEGLLLAVGSRETNLTDETGDGGHGHGVWQLDDRSHQIPNPYPVDAQAEDAANHLIGTFRSCGTWLGACAAYNSGQCDDRFTTGGDYAADCMARARWIAFNLPWEDTMPLSDADKTWISENVRGHIADIWNGQISPELVAIKAELDAIKTKVGT